MVVIGQQFVVRTAPGGDCAVVAETIPLHCFTFFNVDYMIRLEWLGY